jgi:hypothetical protein
VRTRSFEAVNRDVPTAEVAVTFDDGLEQRRPRAGRLVRGHDGSTSLKGGALAMAAKKNGKKSSRPDGAGEGKADKKKK